MRIKNLILILMVIVALPTTAQIFNFSLPTNNQQLIDKATDGAFVKINQSYELCDTVKDEHFGRSGKDYFSIVPFIGVETEKGLIFNSAALSPWSYDKDFEEYQGQYKPMVSQTTLSVLNNQKNIVPRDLKLPLSGTGISKHLILYSDSTHINQGLKVDTVPGSKDGWFIWLSSNNKLETDSVKFMSINKKIEVPIDGGFLHIDKPEISDDVYGGIYVIPVQSAIGQITFKLTGVLVLDEDGWVLDFPFIKENNEKKQLTPINGLTDRTKLNPLKTKRK